MRRRTIARLPFPTLISDVRDVVYASWLVPVAAIAHLVPERVRVIEHDGLTLLTVLTYRHGHFGPRLFGPFRRLFPSPAQSNWRLYVAEVDGVPPPRATVLFVSNLFDSALYALGTRLMSDALPSHLAPRFSLRSDASGARVEIDGGDGSAPSLELTAEAGGEAMPAAFARWFGSEVDALATVCLQDAALARTPPKALAEAWIDLPIDIATIEQLTVTHYEPGTFLREVGATSAPWCFRVPAVRFTVLGERLLPPTTGAMQG